MTDKKKKVALVAVRYGIDINGGAEFHCRMLAERLTDRFDVEVLTTTVKDYVKGGNSYPIGSELINGVTVRRFAVPEFDNVKEYRASKRNRLPKRVRKILARLRLLSPLSSVFPVWKWRLQDDIRHIKSSVFYSEDMIRFIKERKNDYDAIIVLTADYAPFYYTAIDAGEKMLAIPTLHNASVSYRVSLTEAFSKIKYVGFNTGEEQRLARRIFGKALKANGILSVGIDQVDPAPWKEVKARYNLPDRYICFVGRVCNEKVGRLTFYYDLYRKKYGDSTPPMVMVGGTFGDVKLPEGVIYTGFVTDAEKRAIMAHATVFVNPSRFESLSLVVLEALNDKVPVLVNGHCAVLKEHCIKSGGAVKYYTDRKSFISNLHEILTDDDQRQFMAEKGYIYYRENYNWDLIMGRLYDAISFVSGNNTQICNNTEICSNTENRG